MILANILENCVPIIYHIVYCLKFYFCFFGILSFVCCYWIGQVGKQNETNQKFNGNFISSVFLYFICLYSINTYVAWWLSRVSRYLFLKFENGLNIKIDIVHKVCIWVTKVSFCQNDPIIGESFWQKNSLVTIIFFELCLVWYFANSQILGISLYLVYAHSFIFYWFILIE